MPGTDTCIAVAASRQGRARSTESGRIVRLAGTLAAVLFAGSGLLTGPAAAQTASDPGAAPAPAGTADRSPNSGVSLVAEVSSIRPGEPFHVALHVTLDPGWHTYWINAGDAGLPLTIDWRLPDGFETGPLQWPTPSLIPVSPLASYGYEGQLVLPVQISPPADLPVGSRVRLSGTAEFLVCEEICLPASGDVELELAVAAGAPGPDPNWGALIADTRARLPRPAEGWDARAWAVEGGYVFEVAPADARSGETPPVPSSLAAPYLFVDSTMVIEHPRPQRVARTGDAIRIFMAKNEFAVEGADRLGGVLVAELGAGAADAWIVEAPVGAAPPDVEPDPSDPLLAAGVIETGGIAGTHDGPAVTGGRAAGMSVPLALLFALVGGLILNLMPCVFPVLSVKVLGFVEHGGGSPGDARRHGLAFAAGVVGSFWILAGLLLALRAGGESLGWGFQLQSPVIVAALALLLFGLGLNLSGVFEIGVGLTRLGAIGGGRGTSNALLTGGLTVLVASPCTAPFMGAALGFALVQPALVGLAVFTALGLGLAAPYLVLSVSPSLLRRLPRPGPWMVTLRQALAFPLYATVVWLVWVFGRQAGVDATALLLLSMMLFAFGAWGLGRTAPSRRPALARAGRLASIAVLLGAAAVALQGARLARPPAAPESAGGKSWAPYSPERLSELRSSGRPVFLDFTAAWCLSCQVNERVALDTEPVRTAFAEADVALLKADWTNRDPQIAAAIESFGRSGVPLYVLYPAGGAGEPEILPAVLTPRLVVEAVRRAAVASGRDARRE